VNGKASFFCGRVSRRVGQIEPLHRHCRYGTPWFDPPDEIRH